jgi:class 3 adenylate cyclase
MTRILAAGHPRADQAPRRRANGSAARRTVTFMFTDIEASTPLLTRDPDAYPAVVAAQRSVIADAARERGGVSALVQPAGDPQCIDSAGFWPTRHVTYDPVPGSCSDAPYTRWAAAARNSAGQRVATPVASHGSPTMPRGLRIGVRAAFALLLLVGCSGAANQQVAVPPADPPQMFDPSRELQSRKESARRLGRPPVGDAATTVAATPRD